MTPQTLLVISSYIASFTAVGSIWVTGRRERKKQQLQEEAEARQVIVHVQNSSGDALVGSRDQVRVENHTNLHLTDVEVIHANGARVHDAKAMTVEFWRGRQSDTIVVPLDEGLVESAAAVPLVPPGESATFNLEWRPSGAPSDAPAPQQPEALFDTSVTIQFRDGRGVLWVRTDHSRPERMRTEVRLRHLIDWRRPVTWWASWQAYRGARTLPHR
ncbi:hypothetical protein ABZV77_40495 [Streptomyces sp. NPDC004732]|uniref:hypothetical protein n=1 Tax=Streptomyces sp. NPDC004732 TaxID=3154290 RepID=UPI0033B2D26B